MEVSNEVIARRVLLLLKLDSTRLIHKIEAREDQYLSILSIKRSRVHFDKVFENRYKSTSFHELKSCPEHIIESLYRFYGIVDDLEWYLGHTEDQPGAIKDKVDHFIVDLLKAHKSLISSINIEQNGEEDTGPELIDGGVEEIDGPPSIFGEVDESVVEEELASAISEEVLKDLSS